MSSSTSPQVLHRNRRWLRQRLEVCLLGVFLAVSLGWVLQGLSPLSRGVLVAAGLGWALRLAAGLQRTVTLDAEGLRLGSRLRSWSALTSVRPGPGAGWLGSLTLHFGDKALHFDREWPLEALLVEVLARAPLEAQLARALDRREREHGVDFGAVWVGPRTFELRKMARTVPLEDVRGVGLGGAGLRVQLTGGDMLDVPLTELHDPHVLATLLFRLGSRGSTARLPFTVESPLPTDATPAPPVRVSWAKLLVNIPFSTVIIFLGGAVFFGGGISLRLEARDSARWRAVPAEITLASTWKEPSGYGAKRHMVDRAAVRYRFVLDGVEHVGSEYGLAGTDAGRVRWLRVGQQVTAYVPPDDPGGAVLNRSEPSESRMAIFGGLLFMGFALWFYRHRLRELDLVS
jgi:hypothetical protein